MTSVHDKKRKERKLRPTIYPYQAHLYELDNGGVSLGNGHSIIDQPLHNCLSDEPSQGIVVTRACVPSQRLNSACSQYKNLNVTINTFPPLGLTKISKSELVCNEPCDTDFCDNLPRR